MTYHGIPKHDLLCGVDGMLYLVHERRVNRYVPGLPERTAGLLY